MIKVGEIHAKKLAEVGELLYEKNSRSKLEPVHNGKCVVIDTESGDYFLGKFA
jgi:hypothetical protein